MLRGQSSGRHFTTFNHNTGREHGCEGYSSNLFIPAKSELTSEYETLSQHVFFLHFNEEYQDLTRYSLIEQLQIEQLMPNKLKNLPN